MDIEIYRHYCISKKGVTESFPFSRLPNLLVFKVAGKMFTATDITTFESISLKCNPELIDEVRAKYSAITKHKYFSERHWNLIFMDNTIPDKLLFQWIDDSYNVTVSKLTNKKRTELNL